MPRVALTDRFVQTVKCDGVSQRDFFDAKTPGLSLRVSAKGRRVWSFIFTSLKHGKRARITLGLYPSKTLAAARAMAEEARGALKDGNDPREILAARDASTMTVLTLYESWLEKHVGSLRSAKNIETRMKRNVIPVIGDVCITDLHRRDINRVVDPIIARKKPTEANRTFENIRAMLRWATRRGDLDRNPIEGMAKPAAENGARERTLNDDEIQRFWNALPTAIAKGKVTQRALKLCLLTGQRVGEVAGMRIHEIDFKGAIWTIPGARTKNGTTHAVPLSDPAIAIIREVLAEAREKSNVVFPSPIDRIVDGKCEIVPIDPHALGTALRRAQIPTRERPGGRFGIPQFTAHDLRRTVLTNLAKMGVQPIVIGSVANHLSVTKASVTFAHYVRHDYAQEKRDALELWAERLTAIISGDAADVVSLHVAGNRGVA